MRTPLRQDITRRYIVNYKYMAVLGVNAMSESMSVSELREKDCIENVESGNFHARVGDEQKSFEEDQSDDYWIVTTVPGSYNDHEALDFLLDSLNVVNEVKGKEGDSSSRLVVPKGKILQ